LRIRSVSDMHMAAWGLYSSIVAGSCRMRIVDSNNRIKLDELSKMAEDMFGKGL
jgi:hypothetical protein